MSLLDMIIMNENDPFHRLLYVEHLEEMTYLREVSLILIEIEDYRLRPMNAVGLQIGVFPRNLEIIVVDPVLAAALQDPIINPMKIDAIVILILRGILMTVILP